MNTKETVLQTTRKMFAETGYEGVSMRNIAKEVGIAQSVLYHHFSDKDALLEEMFMTTRKEVGQIRSKLPEKNNLKDSLNQRIAFQMDNAEYVVAILKYYFHYRDSFPKHERGFIPVEAYRHIEEILEDAADKNEITSDNLTEDAQVITHAINGFVMEYYPAKLTTQEKNKLVTKISQFILRGLQPKGGVSDE